VKPLFSLLTLLFLGFSGKLIAQGPLLEYYMLGSPGETYTYLDDTVSSDLLRSWEEVIGADVTWNFSDSLTPAGKLTTVHYLPPDSLPLSSTAFLLCNLGNTKNYADYNYFNKNSASIQYYGSRYVPPSGNAYVYYYGNPLKLLQLPFAYSDNFTDYFTAGFPSIPGLSVTRRGTIQATADAYGTAVMPGNQIYTNVLRVKNQIFLTDSDYNAGRDSINDLYYDYYQGQRTFPLLQMGKRITYTSLSQTYRTLRYIYIRTGQALSAPIKNISSETVRIFPNPADDRLQINISSDAAEGSYYELLNMQGTTIVRGSAQPGNTQSIDLGALPSGLYLLRYSGVTYQSEHKIVKQ